MSERAPQHHETKANKLSHHESREHTERLREHIERSAENTPERSHAEQEARIEVAHEALPSNEYESTVNESANQNDIHTPTRKEKQHSFATTMHHIRKDLRPTERTLSKVIHQPTVEKVSDLAGKTVARPSGVIGATSFGLVGLIFVFGIAKYAGFQLSGSEMPLLLGVGFIAGLLTEWIYKSMRSLVTPKN